MRTEWSGRFLGLITLNLPETIGRKLHRCFDEYGNSSDEVYLLCFSLIMLSVDLWCPHVKNKMSKREFIRNTRRVARNVTDDFLGHLYDNVYLIGHVVLGHLSGPPTRQQDIRNLL
ncbi:F-box protein 8 [Clonorchis sinensis]|uniref:F-box protein 8 n=1 Tax=Clonorchis sinensis TaxID=79923 RepID=G7YGZ3_CLOSI|nr:F-box protein 8 [Clonorchis sinensis]